MKKLILPFIIMFFICSLPIEIFSQDYIKANVFGSSNAEFIHGYSVDNNGDLIICGTFQYTVDFNMNQGEEDLLTAISDYDIYIAKYDIMGNYKWAININGAAYKNYYVKNITTDQNGNIYIIGFADSWMDLDPSIEEAIVNQEEDKVFFFAKYNSSGEYLWGYAMGNNHSSGRNYGWNIAVDKLSENIYVCGNICDTVDFDPSENVFNIIPDSFRNFFLAKYSVQGEFVWAKIFPLVSESGYGTPIGLQVDQNNHIYLGGYFDGSYDMDPTDEEYILNSAGQNDGFLSKYDPNGNLIWAFSIGSSGSDYIRNFRYFNGKIYTVGAWSNTIDFDPSENSFELVSLEGEYSGFMSVYDTDGLFQSAIGIEGYMGEYQGAGSTTYDVDIDSENNIYLIGDFYGTVDFDPSDGIAEHSSTGGPSDRDMFLAKYNSENNYIWSINIGGQSNEWGFYVKVNGDNNLIAFGNYDGICDFDPSNEDDWIPNNGNHDVYLAWYSLFSGSSTNDFNREQIQSTVTPNPFTTLVSIEYKLNKPETIQLTIYNHMGQLIYRIQENQAQGKQQLIWNANRFSNGIYYYRLQIGEQLTSRKMVKTR